MTLSPLFLIGSGRSGSSIVAHILSHHPDVSFLTPLASFYPERPFLNRSMLRCLSLPGGRRMPGAFTQLSEAYGFWEHHAAGFRNPCRDLTRQDVTVRKAEALRSAVADIMIGSRPRFFAKITGWSRVGYLKAVFPDARFVHLVRDGRDVANSLLHVGFWDGWQGPDVWRYGPLAREDRDLWEDHNRSFVVLAGLTWKMLVRSVEKARTAHPDAAIHDVRYEDFLDDPVGELQEISAALDLPWREDLAACAADTELHDQRGRHNEDLSENQTKALNAALAEPLERYGYT